MFKIKPHKWVKHGHNVSADFFPFIDDKPAHEINDCRYCIYDNGTGVCEKSKELNEKPDEKIYLFCGNICGYFEPREIYDLDVDE